MDVSWVEGLGLAAGCCTTLAFLPQVLKAWRSRCTKDLSLGMYLVFAAGVVLWLGYGLLIGSLSLILANGITLVLVLAVIFLKLRHG